MSAIFTYLYRVLEHCEESEYSIRSNSYASCGVEHVAEECAADYQQNHGGRESNWPLTFKVFDVGGKHLGTCIVEREVRPVFSAVLLSKESQIAAKAAELFGHLAPPGDGGGERVTEEWLRSIGGVEGTAPGGNRYFDFAEPRDGSGTFLRLHSPLDCGGECMPDLFDEENHSVGITRNWPKTRADVLNLLSALGIKPSAPQPAGERKEPNHAS